jgi:hypothetical protein
MVTVPITITILEQRVGLGWGHRKEEKRERE